MEVSIFLFFSGKNEGVRKIWRIFPSKVFSKHFSRNHQILQVSKKKQTKHYPYININNKKMLDLIRITCSFLVHVLQITNKYRRMKNSYMERNYPIIPEKKKTKNFQSLNFHEEVVTLVHFALSFLNAHCKSWDATRTHITTELSTISLQIICNQEGKGKVVLNPHP